MAIERPHIRIAVDAMGGDFAPRNIVAGALEAVRASSGRFEVLLIGPEELLREEVRTLGEAGAPLRFVNASQVIDMHDVPTASLKQKKDSSIAIGMNLHKDGNASAFVSAGNTGAVMSASTLILGRIEGVGRPTIGAFLPSDQGVCLLVDAGANVDCRPQHLYEFGLMGSIYAEAMLNIARPAVGLLNIGEEDSKGNEVVREAHKLLRNSSLNFIGNVEGRDILAGKAQVVVCDGFVGNILLKFGESVPAFFKSRLKQAARGNLIATLAGGVMRKSLRAAMKGMDYEEHGGVPVLGVNGVSIIGHGKSSPKAVRNMILKAEEMVTKQINQLIQQAMVTAK